MVKDNGAQYRASIQIIRSEFLKGEITLNEAKSKVAPILDSMNAIGRRIAKEHGKKFSQMTFSYVFR